MTQQTDDPFAPFADWLVYGLATKGGDWPNSRGKDRVLTEPQRRIVEANAELLLNREKWQVKVIAFEAALATLLSEAEQSAKRAQYEIRFDQHYFGSKLDGWDFSIYHFPCSISFERVSFGDGDVSFIAATFGKGAVSFNGANFGNSNVLFSGANFGDGEVSFVGTAFGGGDIWFDEAIFGKGTLSFGGATFGKSDIRFFRLCSVTEIYGLPGRNLAIAISRSERQVAARALSISMGQISARALSRSTRSISARALYCSHLKSLEQPLFTRQTWWLKAI